ncbi:hypothetical protein [Eisenbergiella tayi]|uniref:hypothetical protein n=1 Tax=Eisenbergiella tayi TaxID=1432052 RepID=UPI00114D025C|nr:hypothetical protein [Eisenbergiella tayi]
MEEKVHYSTINGIQVYDNEDRYDEAVFSPYVSQAGVQGYLSYFVGRFIPFGKITILYLFYSSLLALVAILIVRELAKKYNSVLAAVFFFVFWLSPWIVNYARNLYWVEFTWFLPMFIGLMCVKQSNDKKRVLLCSVGMFGAVLLKSLCGYEFITTVMLGGILFPLSEWVNALLAGKINKNAFYRLLCWGAELCGFLTALFLHSFIRGGGNFFTGFKIIFNQDILRRTLGGEAGNFDPVLADSINATCMQVINKYFHFNTQIIMGIDGKLFSILSFIPVLFFIWDWYKSQLKYKEVIFYLFTFVTSISWYILGKSHSYVHTHLNFICWYFGFIQICLYLIIMRLYSFLQKKIV